MLRESATVLVAGLAWLVTRQAPAPQDAWLARLAIELGATRDVAPISLDPDGSRIHGVAYDRFARAHLAARVASLKGSPFDPLHPPPDLMKQALVAVAVPLVCGARTVRPVDVDVFRNGSAIEKWQRYPESAIAALLPGATVPSGAIAVQFTEASLVRGEEIRIVYADAACAGSSRQVLLTTAATEPRGLERPVVEAGPGIAAPKGPVTLDIKGVIDPDGRLRHATAANTDTPFGALALDAALRMRFEPARINRTPVPWTAGVLVTFGAAAPPSTASGVTPDDSSLADGSGKCPVSSSATYGVSGFSPISIGGGVDGPQRAIKYLTVLRGPAGQGVKYESAGPVLAGKQIIDTYQVQYSGLAQPVRLYFDSSREGPLLAPKGFACAAPIVVK